MGVVRQSSAMTKLTGTALLAHHNAILANGGSKVEAVKSAGYTSTKPDGSDRIQFCEYYSELMVAQGKMHKVRVTITDTFGGEANYSWVQFHEVYVPIDRDPIRYIKKQIGWTGVKCDKEDWGCTIVLRPRGQCVIIMIDWM
jgi:hypothetical protein